jgi:hypothetical protein
MAFVVVSGCESRDLAYRILYANRDVGPEGIPVVTRS